VRFSLSLSLYESWSYGLGELHITRFDTELFDYMILRTATTPGTPRYYAAVGGV